MSEDIEMKRECLAYAKSQYSMREANYHITEDPKKRCNVCTSGGIVLFNGARICTEHDFVVSCSGTCDLHILIDEEELQKRFGG